MNYQLAARLIVWNIIALFAVNFLGFLIWCGCVEIKRHLARRKANKELRALYARNEKARVEALRSKLTLADQMMREGVIPISEKFFDETAFALDTPMYRKAQSLGFTDDNPKRAS